MGNNRIPRWVCMPGDNRDTKENEMTDQTAIEEIKGIDLANFGARADVRELSERIRTMLSGGSKYTLDEARTLAQIAIAHDLDPFNGECWLLKNQKSGEVLGALIGIKGHRKHAKRQSAYWGDFHRIVDPTEYNAPERSIVFEYHIRDEVTMEAYTKRLEKLVDIGMKLDEAQKCVGKAPVTVGIGIWEPGEKTKMKPAQCAMFRAEKDALKRRFDVKFKIELDGIKVQFQSGDLEDEPDQQQIEGEYEDIAGEEEPRDTDEIIAELGYGPNGEASQSGDFKATAAGALVLAGYASNEYNASAMLQHCTIDNMTVDEAIAWARLYRGWRDKGETVENAAGFANLGQVPK
jgi:hypothetical protein